MAHHRHGGRAAMIVGGLNRPPGHRLNAENVKQRRGDPRAFDALGPAVGGERERILTICADGRERLVLLLPGEVVPF